MYSGLSLDQAPPEDIPFRFFRTAPIFLSLLGLSIAWWGGEALLHPASPLTAGLTHLFTLGWLGMIMLGAFYQMIPVMIGGEVPFLALSRSIHGLMVLGILALLGFFLTLESYYLIPAFGFLGFSLLFFLFQTSVSLWSVEGERPTLNAMRGAIVSLAIVVALGLLMLGEYTHWWEIPLENSQLKGLHLIFGLFGWVALLIMGVSFHLIPMFYVTPPFDKTKADRILTQMYAGLFLSSLAIFFNLPEIWQLLFSLMGIFALAYFSLEMWRLLSLRMRKRPDPTLTLWKWGLLYLMAFILGTPFLFLSENPQLHLAITSLFFAFSLNITVGMLFKIFPFLIWFHRFSHRIGQENIPMLGDLLNSKIQFTFAYLLNILLVLFPLLIFFAEGLLLRLAGLGLFGLGIWLSLIFTKLNAQKV